MEFWHLLEKAKTAVYTQALNLCELNALQNAATKPGKRVAEQLFEVGKLC